MTHSGLWRNDASTLSKFIREGVVTPLALLEMYIERYERFEPILNAFAVYDREGARRAASDATERQRAGRLIGPLDGIPVSVKDNLYVNGLPACWGSLLFQNFVAGRDDIVVERLRSAGAVIVGKTTTPEFAMLQRTQSRLTGVTRNPWNPALTPGGSSGGAVASVAAGVVPLAIATDAGGSTRMPAGYTGLVGLRPSNGRIPRCHGFPAIALDFQAIGLLCRTMADLDLMLTVLSGPDYRDLTSINLPPLQSTVRPYRIGWFSRIGDEIPDPAVEATHREAVQILASCGHEVVESDPPFDIMELRAIWDVLVATGAARVALKHESWEADVTEQIAFLARKGASFLAVDYVRALDRLQAFRASTSARLEAFDTILTPTTPAPAWAAELDHPATIGGKAGSGAIQGMFGGWVNALGLAGINIPGAPHADGRPIGLQVVAPFGRDGIAVAIGRQLEKVAPWASRWPELATSNA